MGKNNQLFINSFLTRDLSNKRVVKEIFVFLKSSLEVLEMEIKTWES